MGASREATCSSKVSNAGVVALATLSDEPLDAGRAAGDPLGRQVRRFLDNGCAGHDARHDIGLISLVTCGGDFVLRGGEVELSADVIPAAIPAAGPGLAGRK